MTQILIPLAVLLFAFITVGGLIISTYSNPNRPALKVPGKHDFTVLAKMTILVLISWVIFSQVFQRIDCPEMTETELLQNIIEIALLDFTHCP